jgi:hypothetical protein
VCRAAGGLTRDGVVLRWLRGSCVGPRVGVQGGAPAGGSRGRTTLHTGKADATVGAAKNLTRPAGGSVHGGHHLGLDSGEGGACGAPGLIWVLASGCAGHGDKMIDGVVPGVRGRSVFQGRPRQRVAAGSWRELAAAHLLTGGHGTHIDHRHAAWTCRPAAGSSGGKTAGSTGASASSPRPARMWRMRRASLRVTDSVARFAVSRSRTVS